MISNWLADRLVPFFDVVAEAAWIAVVGAAIDIGLSGGTTAWGPLPYAIAAAAGLLWIRQPNDEGSTAVGLIVLMVVGGAVGGVLQSGWPGSGSLSVEVLLRQSAVLLMPVAVLRGSRHRQRDEDDLVMSTLLTWGIPLLALPWILGTSVPEPFRSDFIAAAFPWTVLFVAAGLLGLGLARLEALSATAPVHWRQNRSWLILLGGVVAAVTLIAIPAAFLVGTPLTQLLALLLGPLAIILTPIGALLGAIFEVLFFWLDPLIAWIKSVTHAVQQQQPPEGGSWPLRRSRPLRTRSSLEDRATFSRPSPSWSRSWSRSSWSSWSADGAGPMSKAHPCRCSRSITSSSRALAGICRRCAAAAATAAAGRSPRPAPISRSSTT